MLKNEAKKTFRCDKNVHKIDIDFYCVIAKYCIEQHHAKWFAQCLQIGILDTIFRVSVQRLKVKALQLIRTIIMASVLD